MTASCGLVLLSPLMAVVAILIKRDSEGPVLFTQERVGRDHVPFTLYKFRTMRIGRVSGPAVTAAGDPRVTRVGAKLRATKLDELPQLVNVVKGDMALAGPRPEVAAYVACWSDEQRTQILSVRPGITDPVTVNLRREEDLLSSVADAEEYYRNVLLPQKASSYVEYVRSRTAWGDVRLMLRTLRAVVRG